MSHNSQKTTESPSQPLEKPLHGALLHDLCNQLRVKDNGAGIDKENLSRVFEPGFWTKGHGPEAGGEFRAPYKHEVVLRVNEPGISVIIEMC